MSDDRRALLRVMYGVSLGALVVAPAAWLWAVRTSDGGVIQVLALAVAVAAILDTVVAAVLDRNPLRFAALVAALALPVSVYIALRLLVTALNGQGPSPWITPNLVLAGVLYAVPAVTCVVGLVRGARGR